MPENVSEPAEMAADRAFFRGHVQAINGWLGEYAALATMHALRWQVDTGIRAPLFEIGVFGGKYFSLLLRSAASQGDHVVGLDPMMWIPQATLEATISELGLGASYTLLADYSTLQTPAKLLLTLGSEPRFISIDGSHEKDDVVWDLRMAEAILAPRGLISVDDFLNPVTLGVNEGVHAFFATARALEPVFVSDNKLYLARPPFAQSYRDVFEAFVVAEPTDGRSAAFRRYLAESHAKVEQKLWGKTLIVAVG